jgi:hypothetical protein
MHQMVVPLGFAVLQLIPGLFVIVHKAILDSQSLRYASKHPISKLANLSGPSGSSARPKRVFNSAKPIFANVSRHLSLCNLLVIVFPR